MKAFTDAQALALGRSILNRFEKGLNGQEWKGTKVVLPIRLEMSVELDYPALSDWNSSVELSIPYFFVYDGPGRLPKQVTLDEYLEAAAARVADGQGDK